MVKSIIIVAALLAGLSYSAFFLMWNSDIKVNLITWRIGGDPYWLESIPLGFLPIAGAVLGAVVMAIAAWLPWASQRAATKAAEARVQKAVDKFNEQKKILKARNDAISELEARLEELQAPPAAEATVAAPVVAEPQEAVATPADEDEGEHI